MKKSMQLSLLLLVMASTIMAQNTVSNPDNIKRKCVPCEGIEKPLSPQEEQEYHKHTPAWTLHDENLRKITRTVTFNSFTQAMNFAGVVASIAQQENHHPAIKIEFNKVDLELYTHAIQGLSENDFIMAGLIDQAIATAQQEQGTLDMVTTLQSLKQVVEEFVHERDWEQFHSAKNLSMNLAIEAAELMEHFLWCTNDEVPAIIEKKRTDIQDELSDVVLGILCFANRYNIDITKTFLRKLDLAKQKYPVEKVKGKSDKYTAYQ